MYKTIVIPIEMAHVDESKATIDTAIAHGGKDTRIILLNVVEEIPNWAAVALPTGILDKSVRSSQEILNTIAEADGTEIEIEVRIGHPYKTILEVADEKGADLIIVASHQPELQDYLLGSTASKVVRHARCSVLVVR